MRSDCEEIPEGFTKEQADRAETLEAAALSQKPAPDGQPRLLVAPNCQVYWPAPYEVCGAIRDKYNELGGPNSFLLLPNSNELTNPDGAGKRTVFMNGPIYWSASAGAHPVVNSFLNRWGIHQYEAGWLEYPTTDEIVLPDGGRRQEFQQGAIYVAFQNAIGSAIQNGPLRDKYNSVGGLTPGSSFLGYLTEDHKRTLPDGLGQMARFQNGVISWHPTYGAWPITGSILNSWEFSGYETGSLGYPSSDQYDENGQPAQVFQHHVVTVERDYAQPNPSDGTAARNNGQIEFYSGDEYRHNVTRGEFGARRAADGMDTRLLTLDWSLSEAYILTKAAYGLNTKKDCVAYSFAPGTGRFLFKDNSERHKNLSITYRYHLAPTGHDDNKDYQMMMGCSFENKTRQKAGNGTLAYGITIAEYYMTYIFRIR
ncbi:LGFP repeat-containing protein [Nocardia suismassiliense]|uniref:LGFP repeat-containing protein n=1 Tax=Nocardia suismassiliense TaxID=2077092 RepID=A0ABW6R5R0_9NOCA